MGLELFSLHNRVVSEISASASQIREANARLGFGLVVVLFYLIIGAFVFVRLESPLEKIEVATYREYRELWLKRFLAAGFSESEIDQLFADIRDAALNGIWIDRANATYEPSWSYGQAFFFSGALISTVGYGRISPRTEHGKMFTIVYCIIGIPLTLALLSAVVVRLREPSLWLRGQLNQRFGHLFHASQIQYFHLGVMSGLLLLVAFLLPSWFFTQIETEWTFLDAFYYCFVSVTTIGLGDYEPGDSPDQQFRAFYKVVATAYLLFGLCCMMLFLATLYDLPELNLTRFFLVKGEYGDSEEKHSLAGQTASGASYGRFDEDSPSAQPPYAVSNGFYRSGSGDMR